MASRLKVTVRMLRIVATLRRTRCWCARKYHAKRASTVRPVRNVRAGFMVMEGLEVEAKERRSIGTRLTAERRRDVRERVPAVMTPPVYNRGRRLTCNADAIRSPAAP